MPEAQQPDRRVPPKHGKKYNAPHYSEASPKAEATPVKAFLASNITPRSSARKGRAGSATSTPAGTPDNSRPSSLLVGSEQIHGLQAASSQFSSQGFTSTRGFLSSQGVAASSTRGGAAASNSFPKFFRASEATAAAGPVPPTKAFMYANGEVAAQIAFPGLLTQTAAPRNPSSIPPDARIFYANRQSKLEDSRSGRRPGPRPIASPTVLTPASGSGKARESNSLSPRHREQVPSPLLMRHENPRGADADLDGSQGPTASTAELDGFFQFAATAQQVSPQSPTSPLLSPAHSALDGHAAQARQERKVLDLEISNSSLLAINRTLEREMRKQTAELRRYRRLTSTGRISIAPSSRLSSSTVESEEDLAFSDEASTASQTSSDRSPSIQASHEARQRVRDEKRLQLDVSKHQELLLDSQRLNQSLKRCLGITEELIAEGRKAVEYKVKINEVQIGGRVLAAGEVESGQGLLSPALGTSMGNEDSGDNHDGEERFHWGAAVRTDRPTGKTEDMIAVDT